MRNFYFLILCLFLCSCRNEKLLPNQKQGSKDLAVFVWQDIAKYGGTNLLITKNLENGISDYVYSEDKDGFQVVCFGDRVGDIQKMFQPHFGNPYKAETNLDVISSFIYGNDQLVMSCGLESGMIDGHYKNLTHLTVIKLSAINK